MRLTLTQIQTTASFTCFRGWYRSLGGMKQEVAQKAKGKKILQHETTLQSRQ
tara:strand:- start:213 stop:368 length:156 start_codon:yes stop_codon:yes gene_type:complete